MNKLSRFVLPALLLAFPVLALARPPLIYHKVANLAAHAGGAVQLSLSSHDVVVTVKTGDAVSVTTDIWAATGSDESKAKIIARYAPKVSAAGNDVVVRSPRNHGWHFGFGWGESPQAQITVVMPADMNISYRLGSGDFRFDNDGAASSIKGESGSGDVYVVSASKQLGLKAGSGDMLVKLANASAAVKLDTGSGDIGFSGTADSLSLGAGSGDITVNDAAAKSASISTGSGDVVAHWQTLTAGASISGGAGSGDLLMYFPASTVIGGRISTGSGDVNTDFPATIHGSHHSYTLAGGPGAIQVEVNTGSGDVTLRKGG
ncbi:MAG: DUF4097 family beta strand repeat-containing protein [Gammaproteobacteria bacterium]